MQCASYAESGGLEEEDSVVAAALWQAVDGLKYLDPSGIRMLEEQYCNDTEHDTHGANILQRRKSGEGGARSDICPILNTKELTPEGT